MRRGWLLLVVLAAAMGWAQVPPRLEAGVLDQAQILPAGRARVLSEKLTRVAAQARTDWLIYLSRGDEPEGLPSDALGLLLHWVAQPPPFGAPVDPGPKRPPGPRGVLHVRLTTGRVTIAVGGGLSAQVPAAMQREWAQGLVEPALASGRVDQLAGSLAEVCERLAIACGVATPAAPAAAAAPALSPEFVPVPPRPWLRLLWFVGLPTLVVAAWLVGREGPGRALLLAPVVALLYAGLYFMLRFRPPWFMLLGATAVVPVVFAATAPPRSPATVTWRPRRRRPSRPALHHGGLGVSGFAGLGADAGRI